MDPNINGQKRTDSTEEENLQERFCSESLKVIVLSDDGFDILEENGLI